MFRYFENPSKKIELVFAQAGENGTHLWIMSFYEENDEKIYTKEGVIHIHVTTIII